MSKNSSTLINFLEGLHRNERSVLLAIITFAGSAANNLLDISEYASMNFSYTHTGNTKGILLFVAYLWILIVNNKKFFIKNNWGFLLISHI